MTDVFDKIISGEFSSYKVFENDDVLAFLDLSQATPGHTLLVPKKHLENIYEYSNDDSQAVLKYLPIIARGLKAGLDNVIGVNILSNNEVGAGQSVLHSHFHLVPRYENDGFIENGLMKFSIDNSEKYTPEKMEEIAKKISEAIINE